MLKTFGLQDNALHVSSKIIWKNPLDNDIRIGTELNLTLLTGHDQSRYYLMPDGKKELMDHSGNLESVNRISLVDEYFKLRLDIGIDCKTELWRYPVYTVSQSESGFDLLYQGSCIIFSRVIPRGTIEAQWKISLEFK